MSGTVCRRLAAAIAVPLILLVSAGALTACQPGADCDPNVFRPEANLRGIDLSGKQLAMCNMRLVSLVDANLRGADLSNANMTSVDLTGADLTGAKLNQVTLTNARLEGAILDTDLYVVKSGNLYGTPATLPAGWTVEQRYLVGPSANLTGASFTGVDWTNRDLRYANLTDATFTSSTLAGANLDNAFLTRTGFAGVDLTGSTGPGNGTNAVPGGDYDGATCSDGVVVTAPDTCTGHGTGW